MGSGNYNESLTAALDLEEALDFIDRIYTARILDTYGLGLALGLASSEFDQVMSLAEKPPPGLDSVFLEAFKFVLDNLPVIGQAKEIAERVQHIVKVMDSVRLAAKTTEATRNLLEDGKQIDSLEPDEDNMKIIRNISSKQPLFQQVLWARYKVEYDRREARAQFRRDLRAELAKPGFKGKPIDIAQKHLGPAPRDLSPDEVYKQFGVLQKLLLRELFRSYVRKYVTVYQWIYHYVTGEVTTDWIVRTGLNQPQWDAIYARFGRKADKRIQCAHAIHNLVIIGNEFSQALGLGRLSPIQLQEPLLSGVEDLWRFWGAKWFRAENYWNRIKSDIGHEIDLSNPVT